MFSHRKEQNKIIKTLDHHFFLVIGRLSLKETILSDLENLEANFKGSPDFVLIESDNFLVSDADFLKEKSSSKSFEKNSRNIFFILANNFEISAQNKLLKVLEEPAENNFYIILCPQNKFLRTIVSRAKLITPKRIFGNLKIAEDFMGLSESQKLQQISKMTKSFQDEKISKQEIIEFIENLELYFLGLDFSKNSYKIKVCEKAKERILMKGVMVKIILENMVMQMDRDF